MGEDGGGWVKIGNEYLWSRKTEIYLVLTSQEPNEKANLVCSQSCTVSKRESKNAALR